MTFITFAHTDGRMYTTHRNERTFVAKGVRQHGNSVVYGAVFLLPDPYYHIRTLDGMMLCSKSALGRNHDRDYMHRVVGSVTPIRFNTLDELNRLMYTEGEEIKVQQYVGNINHPEIKHRVSVKKVRNYSVSNGVDEQPFLELLRGIL